jgi:Flp pilus assembly protein protease CpaA
MNVAKLAFDIVVTVWLAAVAAQDLLHQRISNWLVIPVMFGALLWQIYRFAVGQSLGILFTVISWVVIFFIWRVHIFGGGDAKLLMGLLALFPDQRLLFLISAAVVLVAIPLVLYRAFRGFRTGPVETEEEETPVMEEEAAPREERVDPLFRGSSLATLVSRWKIRIPLPTQEKLETRGKPFVWVFALPGVVYVWWLF